jgi:K+-transporting ATPase KdpF subunit
MRLAEHGALHARCDFCRFRNPVLRGSRLVFGRLRADVSKAMSFDFLIGGIVTLGFTVYLFIALIRPEKF